MTPSDRPKFASLIAGMALLYERQLEPALIEAYWQAMQAWDIEDFRRAVNHLSTTKRFMPRPADFTALRRAAQPTAGEAWAQALDWVRTGAYRNGVSNPETSSNNTGDPRLDAVVRMIGGYHRIAFADQRELPFIEKRFIEHYETYTETAEARAALPSPAERLRLRRG